MKTLKHAPLKAAVVPALFLLIGCGGGDSRDTSGEAAAGEAPAPGPVRAEFQPVGEFIAEGSVTFRRSGDTVTADVLADSHLGPGDYPIHVHEGTCADGGRVVLALTTMTGGEGGEGTSLTNFPVSDLPLAGTYFVQMHRADGTPIACGDIPPLSNL